MAGASRLASPDSAHGPGRRVHGRTRRPRTIHFALTARVVGLDAVGHGDIYYFGLLVGASMWSLLHSMVSAAVLAVDWHRCAWLWAGDDVRTLVAGLRCI